MAERLRGGRFSISKSFRFEAAHQLSGLGADHKCTQVHGHSHRVGVVLTADELASGTSVFAWLFDGAERGTWEPYPLEPAGDVEAAARAIARVLATAGPAEPEPAAAPGPAADSQDSR